MIAENNIRNVKCISTCDTFSTMRGDICSLPITKAKIMESMGAVKILDKLKEPKKTDDDYYILRKAFSKRRMTRVAWVQNYYGSGGAEISNFCLVKCGANYGFDVVGCDTDEDDPFSKMDKADIIIVNNLHTKRKNLIVNYLKETKVPWVKYDHDCCETESFLFENSKLNIFISPMHMKHYFTMCGARLARSITLPLAFDTSVWNVLHKERIYNSVFVPSYTKCYDNTNQYIVENPDRKFFVIGHTKDHHNVTSLGEIHYSRMAEQYCKYETVLHLPQKKCAGERILFEASLSGCSVMTNHFAGHSSWDFNWRDERVLRPLLDEALCSFWSEIERVIS